MARLDKVANSYAKAIYDYLHKDASKVRTQIEELSAFAKLLEGNDELRHALTNLVFTEAQQGQIAQDIADKLKLSSDTKRVLHVLGANRRLGEVGAVAHKLKLLMLESADIVSMTVETASGLDASEKEKVEQRFNKILGKKVEASYVVDPNLIGGLRVTAAGKTYDGSLVGWLDAVQEKLLM